MKPNSIIACKTIIEHMQKNDLKLHNLFFLVKQTNSKCESCSLMVFRIFKRAGGKWNWKGESYPAWTLQLEISEIRLKQDQYKKNWKSLDEKFFELMKAAE